MKVIMSKDKDIFESEYFKISLYLILFLAASVMILKKCTYGFGNIDEAFYLTIPYRLVQGDALLVDEWHVSQLSAFLLYPITKLFLQINGGTEGMILSFRYICTISIIVTALVLFLMTRKYSLWGAAAASLMCLLYIPFGIIALSYNSMGIIFMMLATVIFSTRKSTLLDIISGVLFASAVLCCPYLALIWLLYGVTTIIFAIKRNNSNYFISIKRFLLFSLGCALLAITFLIFVLNRAELKDIIKAMPYILADPGHDYSLFTKIEFYFLGLLTANKFAPIYYFCFAAILFINYKTKNKYKELLLLIIIILTLCFLLCTFVLNHYINFLMLPINFLGLYCFVSFKEENRSFYNIFQGIWIPGLLYTFCINLASDQVIFAISSASTVSLCASVLLIVNTISNLDKNKISRKTRIVLIIPVAALFGVQLCTEAYLRWTEIFWEPGIYEQTEIIDRGLEKGLIVSPDNKKIYYDYIDDLDNIDEKTKNILFLSDNTWLYLCGNWRNSALSSWLNDIDNTAVSRLMDYYSVNPQKLPDTIYASPETELYAKLLADNLGYELQMRTPIGSLIFTKAESTQVA